MPHLLTPHPGLAGHLLSLGLSGSPHHHSCLFAPSEGGGGHGEPSSGAPRPCVPPVPTTPHHGPRGSGCLLWRQGRKKGPLPSKVSLHQPGHRQKVLSAPGHRPQGWSTDGRSHPDGMQSPVASGQVVTGTHCDPRGDPEPSVGGRRPTSLFTCFLFPPGFPLLGQAPLGGPGGLRPRVRGAEPGSSRESMLCFPQCPGHLRGPGGRVHGRGGPGRKCGNSLV